MSAYRHALVVTNESSEERLNLAASLLQQGEGVVVLDGVVALRSERDHLLCEVVEPMPSCRRTNDEYASLAHNAAVGLAASRLGARLPNRPLKWLVVDDYGTGTQELWHAP
jgi:hypothetical protein